MASSDQDLHRPFLRLFTSNEAAIRAFVRRLVPGRADADDIMQEVSVVLWEKFATFRDDGDFRSWAFGVARFEVLAWLRDKGRDRLVLNEKVVDLLAAESAEVEPLLSRQREALETCIERVAPDQRGLLMQAYQPGTRIRELAAETGRTESGLYQWLYRMRRTLLDCIRKTLAGEVPS
ncbi:MAG: sigma-70 family RNA polymerase sigma factor [Verrucomicrobiales bacterium]